MTEIFDTEIQSLFQHSLTILNTRYNVNNSVGKKKKRDFIPGTLYLNL